MRTPLTNPQAQMLGFLVSGHPLGTQRGMAKEAGFDHPQKATAAIMGLVMKGYLVVDPKYLRELKNAER